jgi:hypothetical protein
LSKSTALGPSSIETVVTAPRRPGTSTETISSAKLPSAVAAWARWYERTAKASWSSRLNAYSRAQRSAQLPMWLPS